MSEPAKQIGNYRLLRLLGRGGMGAVHLAEHETTGQQVALKVLNDLMAQDARTLRRFELEQEALSRVDHPGVIRVLSGVERADGRTFFTMEFVDGRTLEMLLRDESPLTAARAVRLSRGVFAALGAAHDVGIVHRDVKPSNVIVSGSTATETVKMLDFGLARLADGTKLTTTGQVMGTLHYMSPEQCEGSSALDARSDVYSAGCVLFEMLAGRPPFVADTPVALLRSHVVNPAPDLADLRGDVPPDLARLVADCLAKQPGARPAGAAVVLERLEALPPVGETTVFREAAEAATVAAFAAPAVAAPTVVAAPAKRGFPWAIVAVIALLLAVGLAFALGREKGRDDGNGGNTDETHSGAAAVMATLGTALRGGDYDAFQSVLGPKLRQDLPARGAFESALADVDARDFSPGLVGGNVEDGRMRVVINGAALPAALGLDSADTRNGVRLDIDSLDGRWYVISAKPAKARVGDSDPLRRAAERAVRQAFTPPALFKTLDMAGIDRMAAGKTERMREFRRAVRDGERMPPQVRFSLDADDYDLETQTWRVTVRIPDVAGALGDDSARFEVVLAPGGRRPNQRAGFRVVEAKLIRDD